MPVELEVVGPVKIDQNMCVIHEENDWLATLAELPIMSERSCGKFSTLRRAFKMTISETCQSLDHFDYILGDRVWHPLRLAGSRPLLLPQSPAPYTAIIFFMK